MISSEVTRMMPDAGIGIDFPDSSRLDGMSAPGGAIRTTASGSPTGHFWSLLFGRGARGGFVTPAAASRAWATRAEVARAAGATCGFARGAIMIDEQRCCNWGL